MHGEFTGQAPHAARKPARGARHPGQGFERMAIFKLRNSIASFSAVAANLASHIYGKNHTRSSLRDLVVNDVRQVDRRPGTNVVALRGDLQLG